MIGAVSGAVLGRIVFDFVVGLDGWAVAGPQLALTMIGAGVAVGDAKRLEPLPPHEQRDTILGWGALIGAVAALACLLLPMPWGAVAAVAVSAATVATLRVARRSLPRGPASALQPDPRRTPASRRGR